MLKKITLGLCCLLFQSLTAQNNNCEISPIALQYYAEDIRSMAHEYMWQTQQDTTAIQIPQQHFDFVATKLSAIIELNTAETDSIFNKYCVHDVREMPELRQFIVFIDSTQAWTNAWMNMEQVTGNSVIDSFMSSNNFTVISHVELPYETSFGTRHYVTISSPIVVNAKGVVNWFKAQEGILMAEQNITYGGAGRLSIFKDANLSYLNFITEWDDCGDGCDNVISWTYSVSDINCEVDYLGSFQFHVWETWSEAPESNCNLTLNVPKPIKKEIIGFYPNPVNDFVAVELPETLQGEKLTLVNSLGQILRTIPINSTTVMINLTDLPKGVYYLFINSNTNAVKLIKS